MVGRDEPVTTIVYFDFCQGLFPLKIYNGEYRAWEAMLKAIANEPLWDYTVTGETYPVSNRWAVFIGKDWSRLMFSAKSC